MKILFILKESLMHERMGVTCLSASLNSQGFQTQLILFDNLGIRKVRKLMKEYMPKIVGYSAMTGEHARLLEINQILKTEFNFLSVFWRAPRGLFSRFNLRERR